ncbi:MAG: hypothetical protein M1814_004648 [Vezdaea aestivalis]|nr:MAG: hypothetical protein M1814_004648 [Vezdaea aestivalis]
MATSTTEQIELSEPANVHLPSELSNEAIAPPHAVDVIPQWNHPKINTYRTLATFFSFIVMGANDAVYGAIIPSLEREYSISYLIVSLIFLSPFVGYISAASLNNVIHMRLGQRGVALIGPGAHLIAYIVISFHPPYPVLVVIFIFAGFGNGILDAAWNAWLGNMANATEILGFLHGFYGLGATLSPLIATTMIAKGGLQWYTFYYVMTGAAALEMAFSVATFSSESGKRFREANPRPADQKSGRTREALRQRVTWVASFFLLIYVGIEVALGGWIVTFMLRVRHQGEFAAGMSATGFWLGLTIGRVTLGFLTPRIGENLSISLYLAICMVLELIFWLVPHFLISAIAVALLGFFLGPLFPAAIVATTKLLPQHLHVGSIGIAAAFGGSGACVLPFAVGAIAQKAGVSVLQPIIMAMLGLGLALWAFGMPSIETDGGKAGKVKAGAIKAVRGLNRRVAACF